MVAVTGNPFVDTGLAALAIMSECEGIDELTIEKMKQVQGDGRKLAEINSKLKSTTMVFTVNSLATHPQIKYEKRIQFYSCMTTSLLESIGFEGIEERCESCGNERSLNLDQLIRKKLVPLGYKDEVRFIGRDWFPLAGSMGSDAQALPAASRSPNLCAKCLLAVHYLPQSTMLMDGRLIVSQSTSQDFWYKFVMTIVKDVQNRIGAGDFTTKGSKEGNAAVVTKMLDVMKELKEIELGTSFFIWKFSNSGQGPDCTIEEVPNRSLQFLFEAISFGLRDEITRMVSKDKKPDRSLLNCIAKGIDYFPLYPSKKYNGATPKLFALYQNKVRQTPLTSLNTALKIANYLNLRLEDKEKFASFGKDLDKTIEKQNQVKKIISEMIENGGLSFDEYYTLFSKDVDYKIKVNYDAWRYINYYIRNHEKSGEMLKDKCSITAGNDLLKFISKNIYCTLLNERGEYRLQHDILTRFSRNKIHVMWLRRQFIKNAMVTDGFSYETWKTLCLNENGKESVKELLYRLRLMWSEWLRTGFTPETKCPIVKAESFAIDLDSHCSQMVEKIVNDYLIENSELRFRKVVMQQLLDGDKDLYWFRKKFSQIDNRFNDEDYWVKFSTDTNGNSIKSLRFFQLCLLTANCFRRQVFKQ